MAELAGSRGKDFSAGAVGSAMLALLSLEDMPN